MKLTKILLFSIIFSNVTLFAQASSEKGVGTVTLGKNRKVCLDSGRPGDKKAHLDAIKKAKFSAWNKYTTKFSREKADVYLQNEQSFLNNLDPYIVDFVVIDSECSEKQRVYTVSIRASINDNKVNSALSLNIESSGIRTDLKNKGIVVLVVPRKTNELISFDARVTKQTEMKSSVDVNEMVSDSDDGTSVVGSTQDRKSITTGGSTVKKSAKRRYDIGDLNDADSQINNLLQPLGMRTLSAARLENMATSRYGYEPFLKTVLDQFSGKSGEYGANISPQTREEVINTIIDIGQGKLNYFLLGTVDSGVPRIDPDTGTFKSEVLVNVQLFKLDDFFGAEVVAAVGPEIKSAFGETDILSEKAALKKAFNEVTNSLVFKLR